MGKILELLTVDIAVRDIDEAVNKYRRMGLPTLPPHHMPEAPIQITDVTVPMGSSGAISLVSPTADASQVKKFIDRRGEGLYAIAVRVDNLKEVMSEWSAAGVNWVLPEPLE